MARFDKLRVSLDRSITPPMLEEMGVQDDALSRSEFLRQAFSLEVRFLVRNDVVMRFMPTSAPDGYAAGFFTKPSPVQLAHEDLSSYVAENYSGALMIISLERDQVVWFESDKVGTSKTVLEYFFEHIKSKTDLKDWDAFVRYFDSDTDYWTTIREHRREITKIVFRYVPPNAFEGKKLAQQYHTAVQAEARNQTLEETFTAAPGRMNPEGEMMSANAEMAAEGAGEREVWAGRKKLHGDGRTRVSESVDDEDMPTPQQPTFIRRVIDRLFRT